MADKVAGHVRDQGLAARTVVIKVRYGDFKTLTRSHTFATPQATGPSFWTAARALLDGLELREGVRLLGVSASGLLDPPGPHRANSSSCRSVPGLARPPTAGDRRRLSPATTPPGVHERGPGGRRGGPKPARPWTRCAPGSEPRP